MSVELDIDVADGLASAHYVPDEDKLRAWAQSACLSDETLEASLKVVDSDESRQLNRDYRDADKPTNVLSFPAELDDLPGLPAESRSFLGDIVLCAPVIAREAVAQGKAAHAHWLHLILHGFLHLNGYDHESEDEAAEMEGLETGVLASLGLPDPYKDLDSS